MRHHPQLVFLAWAALAVNAAHQGQGPGNYYLPPNIYDHLPPGITTPGSINTPPGYTLEPTPAATPPTTPKVSPPDAWLNADGNPADAAPSRLYPGPDDPPTIELSAPVHNSVYTPGSTMVITWSYRGIAFPDSWEPSPWLQKAALEEMGFGDRDINDPTVVDVLKDPKERVRFRTLAQAKLETLKQRQLDVMVKESSVHLHSLRLVSWASTLNPTRATHPHADDTSVLATVPSPEILSGPGHNLAGAAKLSSIQGGAAGTLTWTIPEDWAYEGEFEIFIPTVAGSGSSSGTGSPVHNSGTGSPQDRNDDGNGNGIVSGGGGTRSQTFWILRDVDTRKHAPQYRLFPMVDSPLGHPHLHHGHTHRGGTMRWRDAGIFYGVAAMMLTLVLIGLGVILALLCLRRRRLYSNIGSQSQSQGLTRILQGGRSGTGRNGGLAGSCSTVTLSSRLGSGYELGPGLGLGMGPDMTNVPGPTWAEDPHHQHQQGHCHSSMPSTLAVMDRSEIRPETESPGIEKGGLSKESKEKDPSLYQDDEDTEAHSPTERPMSAASTIVTLPLYEETTEGVTGRASRNISRS